MSTEQRIQKIIADSGLCSRREAERLMIEGLVTLNGKIAKPGDKAIPGKDHIKVNGKLLKVASQKVVMLFYKPRGLMSYNPVNRKENSGTVFEVLGAFKPKLQPVGRLETEHEGLLMLTNDGELSRRLNMSKYKVTRTYEVKIDGHVDDKVIKRIQLGMEIEGKKTKPMEARRLKELEGKSWLEISTIDPRHRLMKKIFENFRHPVDKVRRVEFAGFELGDLERGEYRLLNEKEMQSLYKLVKLTNA